MACVLILSNGRMEDEEEKKRPGVLRVFQFLTECLQNLLRKSNQTLFSKAFQKVMQHSYKKKKSAVYIQGVCTVPLLAPWGDHRFACCVRSSPHVLLSIQYVGKVDLMEQGLP